MRATLALVGLAAALGGAYGLRLVWRRWKRDDSEDLRRKAIEAGIRRDMEADRWMTGEMPEDTMPKTRPSAPGRPLPPAKWISHA